MHLFCDRRLAAATYAHLTSLVSVMRRQRTCPFGDTRQLLSEPPAYKGATKPGL